MKIQFIVWIRWLDTSLSRVVLALAVWAVTGVGRRKEDKRDWDKGEMIGSKKDNKEKTRGKSRDLNKKDLLNLIIANYR